MNTQGIFVLHAIENFFTMLFLVDVRDKKISLFHLISNLEHVLMKETVYNFFSCSTWSQCLLLELDVFTNSKTALSSKLSNVNVYRCVKMLIQLRMMTWRRHDINNLNFYCFYFHCRLKSFSVNSWIKPVFVYLKISCLDFV